MNHKQFQYIKNIICFIQNQSTIHILLLILKFIKKAKLLFTIQSELIP